MDATPANAVLRRSSGATRWWLAASLTTALVVSLLVAPTTSVPAQALQDVPETVTVEQGWGFATVAWTPVEDATAYHIERTPVDEDGEPTADAQIVGIWTPDRYIEDGQYPGYTTFADSGFVLGETYRWRVRAVVDDEDGEWSDPVVDTTREPEGPEDLLTGFEQADGLEWTTFEEEMEYLETLTERSERVRLETIGETYEGRPLHLLTFGEPAPLSRDEIVDSPTVFITCTVHGIERSGREACLILARQLAFSDDAWVTDLLSNVTVLINPTANPDGRAAGRRTNSANQDLNRDHLMLRHPEAVAIADVIREFQPDLIHDAHEKGGGPDNDPMWARSRIINEDLVRLNQDGLILGRLFNEGYGAGWSMLPYTVLANNNWEAWLHNTAGMKNKVGMLTETPRRITPERPGEGPVGATDHPGSQPRRVYTQLWSMHVALDYYQDELPAIQDAVATSTAQNSANEGPVYLDGAWDAPYVPPPAEPATVVLDPAPCGYRLTPEQLDVTESGQLIGERAGEPWESGTVAERLATHGIEVQRLPGGFADVRLAQPLRPVIVYSLDPELDDSVHRPIGTPNMGMVEATRLADRGPWVTIEGTITGIPNRVSDAGCSTNDLIADEQDWPNRGLFRAQANRAIGEARAEGLLTAREATELRVFLIRSGN